MAKVEIEEADLLNMRHVAGVVEQVMAVPEARSQFLRLAKTANPKLSIPEVDAATPVLAEMKAQGSKMDEFIEEQKQYAAAQQTKMDEFLAAQAEDRRKAEEDKKIQAFQTTWDQQAAKLRRDGWRQSGIEQVQKFAEDNGIANLEIAADAFERRNPQPGPVESRPGWNMFNTGPQPEDTFVPDQMKAQGNDDSRLDREIQATLAEIRAGY